MKIAELRKNKNISQEQLAEILDTSRQAVSKWERGESLPDIDKLRDLAVYFDVSIDYLLGYDIEAASIKKTIERIDKCLEDNDYSITTDEIKMIVTKNPNNFNLLVKILTYLDKYIYIEYSDEASELFILYCERAITLFQKDNNSEATISHLHKAIVRAYIYKKKYTLAKEYIESNNVEGAETLMAQCELNLGNNDAASKIASDSFLSSLATIMDGNSTQIQVLLRTNKVNEAYELTKWCLDFINSIKKKSDLFNNVIYTFTFISAICEKNLNIDYEESLSYLRTNKDNIKKIDMDSTAAIKFYYSEKMPIYIIMNDIKSVLNDFIKPLPKGLKQDATFIYKVLFEGDNNE